MWVFVHSADSARWEKGVAYAEGQNLARLLMEAPANHITPTAFANTIEEKLEPHAERVTINKRFVLESSSECLLGLWCVFKAQPLMIYPPCTYLSVDGGARKTREAQCLLHYQEFLSDNPRVFVDLSLGLRSNRWGRFSACLEVQRSRLSSWNCITTALLTANRPRCC